jgi:hypothetical protein
VDPGRRKETPDFYGYTPDGASRTAIFLCMMLNSMLLLLIRSFSTAQLALVDVRYAQLYYACDMGLYLLQKTLRGDFHYWLPIDGKLGLIVSGIMRVGIKTITDFTGIVQFRGSAELGGAYWTFNMFMALIMCFVIQEIRYGSSNKTSDFAVDEETAWKLTCCLCFAWVLVFVLFLTLMKKGFMHTFFGFETGFEWARKFFQKGETDDVKAAIFGCNREQWRAIDEDVKVWVQGGWETWEREKPGWFTEVFKAGVDEDWLTPEELRRQKLAGGGERRKSSIFGGAGKRSSAARLSLSSIAPEPFADERRSLTPPMTPPDTPASGVNK